MGKGDVFVVSAPSGSGKTTICRRLLEEVDDLELSISYTTRRIKQGETDGRDYVFVDRNEFDNMKDSGGFLESATVYGNCYGTARKTVQSIVEKGSDALLEIDVQGGCNIKKAMPEAVMVGVFPPSWKALQDRLFGRGRDSDDEIGARIGAARQEMEVLLSYDYLVVNDDLDVAVENVSRIIHAHRLRRERAKTRIISILFEAGEETTWQE
ncbi:MAG TPA: guanylate kinase [Candidatus Deferrimicrobiaceae bacterium]|jgi:guanylate kinase